jgi:putative hydrolase of the HAD superfamily
VLTPNLSHRHHPEFLTGHLAPTSIRAACLDIDDTLVDYMASGRAGLAALIGHDGAWAHWTQLTEAHYDRFIAGEIDFDRMRLERTRAFFAELGEPLSEDELVVREARRVDAMRGAWRLFDDALPCLHLLRSAGLMLAAVTNAPGAHQRGKLATVGLVDAFDVLVIAEEVGLAKPDPAIFHLACARLGVRPEQAIHVGDRLDVDAVGAHDAGLHGVWLDRSACRQPVPPGIHVVTDLLELPDLLADMIPVAARL